MVLTKDSSVPLKIAAPPEAKLTPAKNNVALFLLDLNDRYGGEAGNPTFSAAQLTFKYMYIKFSINIRFRKRNINFYIIT